MSARVGVSPVPDWCWTGLSSRQRRTLLCGAGQSELPQQTVRISQPDLLVLHFAGLVKLLVLVPLGQGKFCGVFFNLFYF